MQTESYDSPLNEAEDADTKLAEAAQDIRIGKHVRAYERLTEALQARIDAGARLNDSPSDDLAQIYRDTADMYLGRESVRQQEIANIHRVAEQFVKFIERRHVITNPATVSNDPVIINDVVVSTGMSCQRISLPEAV